MNSHWQFVGLSANGAVIYEEIDTEEQLDDLKIRQSFISRKYNIALKVRSAVLAGLSLPNTVATLESVREFVISRVVDREDPVARLLHLMDRFTINCPNLLT